jgi:hypothetical protein
MNTLPHSDDPTNMLTIYSKDAEHGWILGGHAAFTPTLKQELQGMLLSHKYCFAYSLADLPGYTDGPFTITLTTDKPIITPQRRHSVIEREIQDEKCKPLLEPGIIVPCTTTTQ